MAEQKIEKKNPFRKSVHGKNKIVDEVCGVCMGRGEVLRAGIGQGFGLGEIMTSCWACGGTGKVRVLKEGRQK